MTKNEFFKTLLTNQVMPLAILEVCQNANGTHKLYMRQNNAPNCSLSTHKDGSKAAEKAFASYHAWAHEYAVNFDALVEAEHVEALKLNDMFTAINDPRTDDEGNDPREWCGNDIEAAHAEALEMNAERDAVKEVTQNRAFNAFWFESAIASLTKANKAWCDMHAEALEMNYRIDCTNHLQCRHMDAVNQEYVAMRNEADAMNSGFDTSFNRAAKNWGAMCWFSRERELEKAHAEALEMDKALEGTATINLSEIDLAQQIDSAHAEALALNEKADLQRDLMESPYFGALVKVNHDEALLEDAYREILIASHAEALKENERFDWLAARYFSFGLLATDQQEQYLDADHGEALYFDAGVEAGLYELCDDAQHHFYALDDHSKNLLIRVCHERALALDKRFDEVQKSHDIAFMQNIRFDMLQSRWERWGKMKRTAQRAHLEQAHNAAIADDIALSRAWLALSLKGAFEKLETEQQRQNAISAAHIEAIRLDEALGKKPKAPTAAQYFLLNTVYAEFPDALVTLELCRKMALIEGRKVGASLRDCAAAIQHKAKNSNLANTLNQMSRAPFPEFQINQLKACIAKMEKELTRTAQKTGIDVYAAANEGK